MSTSRHLAATIVVDFVAYSRLMQAGEA